MRKGAFELSITAIVVLIIAITVLGLGIGFISKYFKQAGDTVGTQLDIVKKQVEEQLLGGALLTFSIPDNQIETGKSKEAILGIRNTASNIDGDKVCFRAEVVCLTPFSHNSFCDPERNANNVVVGGFDSQNGWQNVASTRHNWFKAFLAEFNVRNNDKFIFPVEFLVRGIKPDSYRMELNLYKDPQNKDCANQGFGDKKGSLYASYPFILRVT